MVKLSPHKKRYTLLTLLFLFLFLSLCSYFTKPLLQPKISLYTDLYPYGPSKSGNSIHDPSSQSSDAIQIPISTGYDDKNEDDDDLSENVELDEGGKSKNLVLDYDNAVDTVNQTKSIGNGLAETVRSCNLYVGSWVKDDENYPIYKPGTCPYVDRAYDCQTNGRKDDEYMKWRWKPDGCNIPRFNATDFLERLRGKRLMLVGDSMNRNQFESLLCLLHENLTDKSKMYEIHGRRITKGKGYFVFKFKDYNCSVEFVRSHFLVLEGTRVHRRRGYSNPILVIDRIDKSSKRWKQADILVFNTGHWWTHGKTAGGKNYFKEGDYIHPQFDTVEAYKKALRTWAKWIDENVDSTKLVLYRGFSSAHFRGGEWDSGGGCMRETDPIKTGAILDTYPSKMKIVEDVIREMQFPVVLLNVTKLTNSRKDGHPSVYGTKGGGKVSRRFQDCSHWCLPGVPDAWNDLIYVTLLLHTS